MKNTLIVIVVCCFAATCLGLSCKKKSNNLNYTINGIQDVTVMQYSTVYLPVNLVYVSGVREATTVSLSGLPVTGVSLLQNTLVGIPTFTDTFTLAVNNAPEGVYPVVVTVSSTTSGIKSYRFNLTIVANPNCALKITGRYHAVRRSGVADPVVGFTSEITSSSSNHITISDLDNGAGPVNATVTCADDSILIPYQGVFKFAKVYGTGHFVGNTIVFNFCSIYIPYNDSTFFTTTMTRM